MSTPAVAMYLQASDQVFTPNSTETSNLQFAAAADTSYFVDASLYVSNTVDIYGVCFSVFGPSNATGTWEVSMTYATETGTAISACVKPTPINGRSPFTNPGTPTPAPLTGKCSAHLTARVQTAPCGDSESAIISISAAGFFPFPGSSTTLYGDSVMVVYSVTPILTTRVDTPAISTKNA
jgi:hypothetical protein